MEIENKLNDFVIIFENVLPKNKLSNLLSVCQSKFSNFTDGSILGKKGNEGVNKEIRDVMCWGLGTDWDNMTEVHWANFLKNIFNKSIQKYFAEIKSKHFVDLQLTNIDVLKYEKSGHYNYHTDHHRKLPRTLSLVFFINDNYEGGALSFCTPNEKHEVKIEPKANKLVVFPSNFLYPHCVEPVKSGVRYSIVSWAL